MRFIYIHVCDHRVLYIYQTVLQACCSMTEMNKKKTIYEVSFLCKSLGQTHLNEIESYRKMGGILAGPKFYPVG